MSSFRSRIRLSALLVIGALLVAFSVLLYSGLSVILHRYLDARLLAFGVNWAEFIEETNEALPISRPSPNRAARTARRTGNCGKWRVRS